MDTDDEDLLVVRAVPDPDAAALGKCPEVTPEIVVVEFLARGRLEAPDFAALRVHTGHDVLDRRVLAGRVHRLEHDEE